MLQVKLQIRIIQCQDQGRSKNREGHFNGMETRYIYDCVWKSSNMLFLLQRK